MHTHLEVSELDAGKYQVKAVQGHVVTRHTIDLDSEFHEQFGSDVGGSTLVREAVEILVEHEALAAVPGEARLDQLVSHYPYLASELQQRLSTDSSALPLVEPPEVAPLPAEDRPTHI